MAVPSPYTFIAGDDATAARMATLSDAANYLLGNATSTGAKRPVALLTQTVAQSINNNLSAAISFDTESFDYDNGHSTVSSTSVYTVQTSGIYLFAFTASFAPNATGSRMAWMRTGGATHVTPRPIIPSSGATFNTGVSGVTVVSAAAGSTWELVVIQNCGVALNTAVAVPDQSSLVVYLLSV